MVKKLKIEYILYLIIISIFILILGNYFNIKSLFKNFSGGFDNLVGSIQKEKIYSQYEEEAKSLVINKDNKRLAKSIPILVYHGIVVDNPKGEEEVSVKNFKEQMFALKKDGYETITLEDFYQFINNKKEFPEKSFIITFDDGRKDSYYPVDPILKALDYEAVIFVITKNVISDKNNTYYLNNDELREMVKSGRWGIESHGRDDHDLIQIDEIGTKGRYLTNKMWLVGDKRLETDQEYEKRVFDDMMNAKIDLQKQIGVDSIGFAFPGGHYGDSNSNYINAQDVIARSIQDHYLLSFYQFRPEARFGYYRNNSRNYLENNYFFRRVKILDIDADTLIDMLSAGSEKDLPYAETFNNKKNWICGWGDCVINDDSFDIKSSAESGGGAIFLDGTHDWDNYKFSATVSMKTGKNYDLVAREKNGKMYLSCSYHNKEIRLSEMVDGESVVLDRFKLNNFNPHTPNDVGIIVNKQEASCLLNGDIILNAEFSSVITNGGVGLKAFRNDDEAGEINVSNMLIEGVENDLVLFGN